MIKLISTLLTSLFILSTNADDLSLGFELKSNQIYQGESLYIVEKVYNSGKQDMPVNFTSVERWLYLVGYYPENPPYWLPDYLMNEADNKAKNSVMAFISVLRSPYSILSKDTSDAEGWFHLIFTKPFIQTIPHDKGKKPRTDMLGYKLTFPYPGIYLLDVKWGNSFSKDKIQYVSNKILINVLPRSEKVKGNQKIQISMQYLLEKPVLPKNSSVKIEK